jgi:hypothetical protein
MKKVVGFFALLALVIGCLAVATPAPAAPRDVNNCKNHTGCGSPEPDSCTGPCDYWQYCGGQCECKHLPGCKS